MALPDSHLPEPQTPPSAAAVPVKPSSIYGNQAAPCDPSSNELSEEQLRALGIDQPRTVTRFWSHVRKTSTCWLWTGATRSGGYGVFRVGARSVSAHRLAWELAYGPIPPRTNEQHARGEVWQVAHRCGTPRCVRPDHLHLFAGPPVGRRACT